MKYESKKRDRIKMGKRKHYLVCHETPVGRRILARKFRRTQKMLTQEGESAVTPIGKDYKTRGWITR